MIGAFRWSAKNDGSTVTDIYACPLASNRLDTITQGSTTTRSFTYDAAGNVTYDNQTGQGFGYSYNAANRMESFSINGVVQEEYVYNALGQQVVRRMGQAGTTIHVVHDLDGNRLAEYEIDNLTGVSTLLQEYIWFDGVPVAVVDGQTDEVFFIRTDHIGRPVFATDDTGAKVWEAFYLPFGGVHVSTGPAIDLRFPGQWFHASSGLHQNWMRDYDPTTGRYIQADPLGLVDGASVYGYALQNPGRYVDPRGETCQSYRLPDGNTGIRCTGPTTYCPSGDCSVQPPTSNVGDHSEFAQCKKQCMDTFSIENWKHGPHAACLAVGAVIGTATRLGPIASFPINESCKDAVCTDKCAKQCGLY